MKLFNTYANVTVRNIFDLFLHLGNNQLHSKLAHISAEANHGKFQTKNV